MTTACVIAAVLILIAGLFAVIVERTNERDDARAERDRLERELEARDAATVTWLPPRDYGTQLYVVPDQRTGEHDSLPTNTDDAIWASLYDENGNRR